MDLLVGIGYLVARYLHIVCGTLIVGGTLFYEMVVPIAIADLKPEQQLAIFARARWVFRQIVWSSAFVLLVSGAITTGQQWRTYVRSQEATIEIRADGSVKTARPSSMFQRPDWWWVAHVSTGFIAVLIAVALTLGSTPPTHPIQWMRLNLIVLMIVIFLGSATRHMRQNFVEQRAEMTDHLSSWGVPLVAPAPTSEPTSQP